MILKVVTGLALVWLGCCYVKDYGRMSLMDMVDDALRDAYETCEMEMRRKHEHSLHGTELFQTSSKFKEGVIEFHFYFFHPLFQFEFDGACKMDVIFWTTQVSLTWSTGLRDLREFEPVGI